MVSIVCPVCKSRLEQNGARLACGKCKRNYVERDNVFDFLDNDFYWGEVSPEYMERTLNVAREKGYKVALKDVCLRYPDLEYYLLSKSRHNWLFHCMPIDSEKRKTCLDLGSGWGNLTFLVANFYKEVWSLDATLKRLKFQKIRNDQEGFTNVKFARADVNSLPFPDNCFDLVISNGVLEWVGVTNNRKKPEELQMDFLNEIRRILKPTGCLYIGIENRLGVRFFLGERDHSGLPFTSIIPRKAADLAVRLFAKTNRYEREQRISLESRKYRTLTYTFMGYKKLLQKAHFSDVDFYWAYPSYNEPEFTGKLNDAQSFKFFLNLSIRKWNYELPRSRKFLLRLASFVPSSLMRFPLSFFSQSYLIYAYKGAKKDIFEAGLLDLRKEASFLGAGGPGGVTSTVKYYLLKEGKLWKVIRFPRFRAGYRLLEERADLLRQFNNLDYCAYSLEKIGEIPIVVEERIKGDACEVYNIIHNKMAVRWLLKYQNDNRAKRLNFGDFELEVNELINYVSFIDMPEEIRQRTARRLQYFLCQLREARLEGTSEHGDFWHQNILVEGEDVRVLDWEYYKKEGNPLFDFCFFIISGSLASTQPSGSFYATFLGRGRFVPILDELVKLFCKEKEIAPELIYSAIPYVLVRCIRRNDPQFDNWTYNFSKFKKLLQLWDIVAQKDTRCNSSTK